MRRVVVKKVELFNVHFGGKVNRVGKGRMAPIDFFNRFPQRVLGINAGDVRAVKSFLDVAVVETAFDVKLQVGRVNEFLSVFANRIRIGRARMAHFAAVDFEPFRFKFRSRRDLMKINPCF